VIHLHITRLRGQIELQRGLCERLEGLAAYFGTAGEVSGEAFLQTIEVMNIRKRNEEAAAAGEGIVGQGTAAWAELLEQYRVEMQKGTDPADPKQHGTERRPASGGMSPLFVLPKQDPVAPTMPPWYVLTNR
jgi:hypothetical protein